MLFPLKSKIDKTKTGRTLQSIDLLGFRKAKEMLKAVKLS